MHKYTVEEFNQMVDKMQENDGFNYLYKEGPYADYQCAINDNRDVKWADFKVEK